MYFNSKELSTIIIFSSLGAILSVPIGYIGNYLKTIPFLPLGTGQILAGLHLIMVALTALHLKKFGAASITGLVKGLVEAVLFSFHGLPVVALSGIQGILIDVSLHVFGYNPRGTILGCGLSALSNVIFIQFIIRLPFPSSVYALMYVLSFASGVFLGAYPSNLLHKMIKARL